MKWTFLDKRMTLDDLGFIPSFLNEDDLRPAREQINESYGHGGGWRPFKGHEMFLEEGYRIKYPGDPSHRPLARTKLRTETILFYAHSWLAIVQEDGSWEIARVD